MMLPFESLVGELYQLGLVVAVAIGFGFGFVLERAGFGRGTKLAAQFYLYDMTVFKVMFGAIVTAMLGVVVFSGLGLLDLTSMSAGAVSGTYVWPMLFGGLLLGAGFIISGYCPGTSLVATSSGNIDGLFAIIGVVIGSVLFGEVYPSIESFYLSGAQGQLFLYQWLGLSPAVLASIVTVVAIGAFFGAEKVEKIMTRRIAVAASVVDESVRSAVAPRRLAFGSLGVVTVFALATLMLPVAPPAQAKSKSLESIAAVELAHQVFDQPWSLRIIDIRERDACVAERVPGAECVPAAQVGELGLAYARGNKQLVIVASDAQQAVPDSVYAYPGKVFALDGGHAAWHAFALSTPEPLASDADAKARADYQFRAAVNSSLTGRPAAPPPAAAVPTFAAPKKKKEGGCG